MASKSVWNLPGGPWERVFAGVWNNFNVAVYENSEKVLLTTIFPKTGEVNWIMIRVDKILLVPKGFEKIEAELQQKNIQILKQRIPERHMDYIILLTPPTTVEFGSKEIGSSVFQKTLALGKEVEEIKALASKKGVEVIDLKDAPYKEAANVMGNPTLLLGLLSVAPEGEEPKKERLTQITLGETVDGLFGIDESFFRSFSSIKRGSEEERNYLAQAIMESAIIDASPMPIIFNFSQSHLKLSQANPYPYDYSRYGFESHNIGFRLESYDASSNECPLKINLNQASPQFLWKLFGLGTDEASTAILSAANKLQQSNSINTIEDLKNEICKTTPGNDKERGIQSNALRILGTIDLAYGDIFSSSCDFRAVLKNWIGKNATVHIDLAGLDKRPRLAFLLYVLDSAEVMRLSGNSSDIETKRLEQVYFGLVNLAWFGTGILQEEIINKIIESKSGGLFVNEGDLPMKIESRVVNKFNITGPGKAKLYRGGRGAEFTIRPLLSCPP
jgi:hypothetical protein